MSRYRPIRTELTRVNEEDILHEIKHNSEIGDVPVIILDGLDEGLVKARDIDDDLVEDAVLKKLIGFGGFTDLICKLENVRLTVVHTDDERRIRR